MVCTIDAADLVIVLGYDMVEYHPSLWNPDLNKRIIHMDFAPAEIDESYRMEVEVVGDLAHALWMLNERVDACTPEGAEWHLPRYAGSFSPRAGFPSPFPEREGAGRDDPVTVHGILWTRTHSSSAYTSA